MSEYLSVRSFTFFSPPYQSIECLISSEDHKANAGESKMVSCTRYSNFVGLSITLGCNIHRIAKCTHKRRRGHVSKDSKQIFDEGVNFYREESSCKHDAYNKRKEVPRHFSFQSYRMHLNFLDPSCSPSPCSDHFYVPVLCAYALTACAFI